MVERDQYDQLEDLPSVVLLLVYELFYMGHTALCIVQPLYYHQVSSTHWLWVHLVFVHGLDVVPFHDNVQEWGGW